MAYGMLTSFALGAAQGLGSAIVNKYSKDQDAEIASKAAADRESRIEEAAIRSEGRASALADKNYNRLRTDTVNDREIKRGEEMVDQQFKINEEERKLTEARAYENEPTTLTGQAKVASIDSAKSSIASQKVESESKRKIAEVGDEWLAATTPEGRKIAEDKVKALTGKIDSSIKLEKITDIIGYDKDGKPTTQTKLVWVNMEDHTVTPVDTGLTVPLTPKQLKGDALAQANAVHGTNYTALQEIKPSTWYGGDSEEEAGKKQDFNDKYHQIINNANISSTSEKPKGGMLGFKTDAKVSHAPFKADDPARQKEYDIIFGGVVKQHESGGKGVNAQNPTSTAGGTWQLTDPTAEFYKAKKDANGKISNAEKDRVAPEFYKDVYRNTNGDPAAMIASGFAPNDVKSAMKDAVKKGTKWWQETDSITPNDMEESYVRARESVARLQSVGIEPDARLLDFVDNYKATKIASATPDKSAFKLKAVRPAL